MTGRAVVFIIGAFFIEAIAFLPVAAEQTSPAREERAAEIQRHEQAIRSRIENGKKTFVEKIVIKGAQGIGREEMEKITLPFARQWLGPDDIEALENSIRHAYEGRGEAAPEMSSQVLRGILEISVAGHDKP